MVWELRAEIFFDGLCEPNPRGIATYGFAIYFNGKSLHKGSGIIGRGKGMTNNVAEYTALLEALKWLQKHHTGKFEEITIKGDSNLVIQQMRGIYKIKSKTSKKFVPLIKAEMEKLKPNKTEYKWIPREENKEADLMSRIAYSKIHGEV